MDEINTDINRPLLPVNPNAPVISAPSLRSQVAVSPEANAIEEQPQVTVSEPNTTLPLSQLEATNRANKFVIGNPKSPLGYQSAFDMLVQDREKDLREQAASQQDFQKDVEQQQAITAIVKKQGRPLSLPESLLIKGIIGKKQANPDTIIEENYAQEFMKTLVKTVTEHPDSKLAEAMREMPEVVNSVVENGRGYKARLEMINTWSEQVKTAYEQQSYVGWGVDFLKSSVGVYQEAKLRGQVPGETEWSGLTTNIENQWRNLMSMPFDQFASTGKQIINKLIQDNPSMAMLWLNAGKGMSRDEKLITDLFPLLEIGLASGLVKGGFNLAKRISMNRYANRVALDMIKSAEPEATKAAISEAAGDIQTAAIEQFSAEIATGNRTPVMNDLQSLLRVENLALNADAVGPSGPVRPWRQELVNRYQDMMNVTFGNFMDVVQRHMKVEQLPSVLAIPAVARQLAERLKTEYQGVINSIFDTKLVRDQATGQWFADHYITKSDGTLFQTERQAKDFARTTQLGEVRVLASEGPAREYEVKVAGAAKTMSEDEAAKIFGQELMTGLTNAGFAEKLPKPVKFDPSFVPSTEVKSVTVIKEKGAGFYLVKTKPVPIDADFVRDLMIKTSEQKTPNKVLNAWGGWLGALRTPEDTLALDNLINRKIAVYGSSQFYEVFKDLGKEISQLKGWPTPFSQRRVKWNQWKDFMTAMENVRNPETGNKGIAEAFTTTGELRDRYMQHLGRPPDEQEIKASFAFRTQEQLKEQLLKFTKLKNQLREGATRWTLSGLNRASETETRAGTIQKVDFTGTGLKEIPTSGTVLVMHTGELGFTSVDASALRDASNLSSSKMGKKIQERIDSGELRIVKLTEPDQYPVNGMYNRNALIGDQIRGDLRVTHVISEKLEDKALSMDHIQVNKPNNHDYDHYVTQPDIKYNPITRTHEYIGDKTIAGLNIHSMSKDIAEHLDVVRKYLKVGNELAAREFYRNSRLPMDYETIRNWFRTTVSPEGVTTAPRLNLDHTIGVTPNGKLSIEVNKDMKEQFKIEGKLFEDKTRETYGQIKQNDPYDIFSLNNTGTKASPLWADAPTKYIDPVTAINRSLVRVINDVHLNDYKTFAIEHWIQEAKDLLKADAGSLASAPAYHFHNPQWLSGLTGKDATMKTNLEIAKMNIQQFLGVRDANTTFLHSAGQILADSIYNKFGSNSKLLTVADKLPLLRDPFQFIRSIVFNEKLGLFAVPQLLVQLQTFIGIGGIAGWDKAIAGTHATLLHTWSRVNRNPEMIAEFDRRATAFGFKPGEFKEAHELLTSTGFENVAGEHAYRDSSTFHDIVGGPGGTFLSWGQVFFREGERGSRTGAFYTAYKEWRETNPVKKLGEVDSRAILQRADLLTSNMSRASSSAIQKGILSLPTQFVSYAIRQAELMIGNRLTGIEKARLFGTYGLVYGVPAAFGSFTMGVGGDEIMKTAIANGYVSDSPENWKLNTAITEGLPSMLIQLMTGNLYNIGQRYAGGGGPVTDLLRSDKTFWDIIGGASYSSISKSIANLDGLTSAMTSGIRSDGPFAIKSQDFIDPFKEISSVNTFDRLYKALNTGKWLSSKELELGDASPLNAIFMSATGLSPQAAPEVGWISQNRDKEKKIQQEGLSTFIKEFRRGLREFDGGNPEQGNDYWQRAFTHLRQTGYPQEDWTKAIAIASEGNESLINRLKMDYYTKKVPETRKDTAQKAAEEYIKSQQGNK